MDFKHTLERNSFVQKPKGKRQFGRSKHRWKDNTMDLAETGVRIGLVSSGSGKGLVVGSCEHNNKSLGFMKLLGISQLPEKLSLFQ
jgi:hypothetical protein